MTALHESVLPDRWSRPVAATAGLQWAWLAATAILAGSAALVSRAAATDVPFLTLAPLASVGIVVATFAPAGEPGGEASFATPMFGLGLILRRLMASLVPALIVLALSAALIADLGVDSLVWLLPALALATATLAVMTFASTRVAGVTTTAVWIATMVLVAADQQLDLLDRWRDVDLFDRRGQMIAVMVTVGSLLVIWLRREHISTPEVAW
jgi:hypothetical protein